MQQLTASEQMTPNTARRLPVHESEPEVQRAMATVFPGKRPSSVPASTVPGEMTTRRRGLLQSSNIQVR